MTQSNNNYSVLMSVYHKEHPEYLKISIDSVMHQTIVPNDIVLVCDGPLTDELYECIDELKKTYKCLRTIQLETNSGLGKAMEIGIQEAKNSIVMRMDSDDICMPYRAELQLPLMEKYDLVGGFISEFEGEPDNLIGIRPTPENSKAIIKFAKKRNPFNHPSVMFKKEEIIRCGNYVPLRYMEDYYLWIRFLLNNQKVYNVQKVLVNMRSGVEMRSRRGTKEAKQSIKFLRKYMYKNKFINLLSYMFGTTAQLGVLSLPLKIRVKLYKTLLRKKTKKVHFEK